ncbi:MAG: hypothetical protein K2X27_25695 [Candidatus Obscuribacterales bacterium]|nr:hypothetical protein [Candidatus Obscuribacterales bacterium]
MYKFLGKILIFLLVPALLLELVSRTVVGKDWYENHFYLAAKKELQSQTALLIFVGSSRTATAIDSEYLSERLSRDLNQKILVLNMGQGYSTLTEHYFGIKRALAYRGSFKNVIFVVEAAHGFPLMNEWHGSWVLEEAPQIIMPVLNSKEIFEMWKISSMDPGLKTLISSGRYLLSARYFHRFRRLIQALPEQIFARYRQEHDSVGIREAGGVSNSARALFLTRETVKSQFELLKKHPQSCPDFADSVFISLTDLLKANEAELLTYVPPQSSLDIQNLSYYRCSDFKNAFEAFCRKKSLKQLSVPTSFPDRDFPDLLHLNKPNSLIFTKTLADELLPVCRSYFSQ